VGQDVILVADDHPLFRDALKIAVARTAPGARILEAATTADFVAWPTPCAPRPDVIP
jgi:DNA-binding NarL/FixJ family response regulator